MKNQSREKLKPETADRTDRAQKDPSGNDAQNSGRHRTLSDGAHY